MNHARLFALLRAAHGRVPYHLGRGRALPPLHVLVELTYRCNLRCTMCQFYRFPEAEARASPPHEELRSEEITALVDSLPSTTLVTFTGGEPFLRRDAVDLLEHAGRRRRTSVVTNGTLIDGDRAERLVAMAADHILGAGLVLVEVSLEGLETTHDRIVQRDGAFRSTVAAFEALVAARSAAGRRYPLLTMKTVINRGNWSEIGDLYGLARELGVDFFNPMVEHVIDSHPLRMAAGPVARSAAIPPGASRPVMAGAARDGTRMLTPDEARRLDSMLAEIARLAGSGRGPDLRLTPASMPRAELGRYCSGELDLADYSCFGPWSSATVSAFGEVFVCPHSSQGNIRIEEFRRIWNGPTMRATRRRIKASRISPGCLGCCHMSHTGG